MDDGAQDGEGLAPATEAPQVTRDSKAEFVLASAKTATPRAATGSKAEYVRSLPPEMSYADAAAGAKEAGIVLSKTYFYLIKSQVRDRVRAAAKSKPVRTPEVKAKAPPAFAGLRLASDDVREQALIDAVRELGVARARRVIDVVEKFERLGE